MYYCNNCCALIEPIKYSVKSRSVGFVNSTKRIPEYIDDILINGSITIDSQSQYGYGTKFIKPCGENASTLYEKKRIFKQISFKQNSQGHFIDTFALVPEFESNQLDVENRIEVIPLDYRDVRDEPHLELPVNCKCPLCGSKDLEVFYFRSAMDWGDADGYKGSLDEKKKKESDQKECYEKADLFVEETINKSENAVIPSKSAPENADVPKFLTSLINIEKDILFLKNRLKEITYLEYESGKKAIHDELAFKKIEQIKRKRTLSGFSRKRFAIEEKYRTQMETKKIGPGDLGIFEPPKPEYQRPGLFNKRKVEEENERVKRKYESDYQEYLSKSKLAVDEYRKKESEKNAALLIKKEQELKIIDDEIAKASNNIAFKPVPILPSKAKNQFYLSEIKELKSKIVELCDARAKLHSLGIIYPKYLNLMALTTISEYYDSGRVDKLKGPDGAYNLYESEIRANRVIDQLDQVIGSLESIKANQYLAYSVLTSISKDTSSISNDMKKAVDSIKTIADNTIVIRNSAEVTAYNTRKTAQYAKINAELTNAMGYLVAYNTL